jgi:hypothetical protein
MYANKQCSCSLDIQRQNLGHRNLGSCSIYDWGYTCFLWIFAFICKPFRCVRYLCATSRGLQHLHFGFWVAGSHFHLWNLVRQKLGLEWHCCSFHICYSGGCFYASEFAQHSRYPRVSCGSRHHLQSYGLAIPVSSAR